MAGVLWTFPFSLFLVRARLPFVPASLFSTRMILLLARLYLYMLRALSFASFCPPGPFPILYIQPHRYARLHSFRFYASQNRTLHAQFQLFIAGGLIRFPCWRYHTFSSPEVPYTFPRGVCAVHVRWLGHVARQRCFSHPTFSFFLASCCFDGVHGMD